MLAKSFKPQLKYLLSAFPKYSRNSTQGIFYHTLRSDTTLCKSCIANTISQPRKRTIWTQELCYNLSIPNHDVQYDLIEDERMTNMKQQRQNRCSLVVEGIPEYVEDDLLAQEVVKILQCVDASFDKSKIKNVHRSPNQAKIVCKFVDHSSSVEILRRTSIHGDRLKVSGMSTRIFIKQHLTKEYAHLNYAIRVAKRQGKIFHYRITEDGVNQIKLSSEDSKYYDITHKEDLKKMGLYLVKDYRSPQTVEEKMEEERECLKNLQKRRMNSVAITGVPERMAKRGNENLISEVLSILQTVDPCLDEEDILDVFQVGSQVICKFVDQKCVARILQDKFSFEHQESAFSVPGVCIEPSLIQQYTDIYEVLRMAKREGRIFHHRLTYDGIHQVQLSSNGDFYDISHETDLANVGLSTTPVRSSSSASSSSSFSSKVEEERERHRNLQEQRRKSVAVFGIPEHLEMENLKWDVLIILQTVNPSINENDILKVFRIGSHVVCKFHDLCAMDILKDSQRLKCKSRALYGENSSIYIEYSLIKEYAHLNYAIRKAYGEGKLHSYRIHDGVNQIRVTKDDPVYKDITHKVDLIELGLYFDESSDA